MVELYIEPVHIPAPEPTPKPKFKRREQKRWIIAQGRIDKKYQRYENEATELCYHAVIAAVIEAIPRYGGDTVISHDQKLSEDFTAMHGFCTSTFFWRLDCLLNYNYEIFYDFKNCPYEPMVRDMMKQYPLHKVCNHHPTSGLFKRPYAEILAFQPPSNLLTIKGKDWQSYLPNTAIIYLIKLGR